MDKLELFLYKNKLADKSLLELIPKFSGKTIAAILKDLQSTVTTSDANSSNKLYVFTDGNCKRNGKDNAVGGYGIFFTDDTNSPYYKFNKTERLESPTNQKCELSAIFELFRCLESNLELFESKHVIICTDSMYVIKCLTEWYKNWIRNNWKTKTGEPVKNLELLKSIRTKMENLNLQIEFKHVPAHTQEPEDKTTLKYDLWYGNNRVDSEINLLIGN